MENNKRDYIYNTSIEDNYTGKSIVLIGASLVVDVEKPELLNGFVGRPDITKEKGFPLSDKIEGNTYLRLSYGKTDNIIYVAGKFTFKTALTEKEINTLKEFYVDILKTSTDFTEVDYEGKAMKINLYYEDQMYIVNQDPLEAPEGYTFLNDLVTGKKELTMYHEFLNNKLMFDRLKYLCVKKGKKVPKESITGVMLPVHQKDAISGATCVMNESISIYEQYKLAQNYINGFEEESAEYQMGVLMMLAPEFAEYILMTAKRSIMGKKIDDIAYRNQLEKAVKYANKHRRHYLTSGEPDSKDINDSTKK